MRALSLFKSPLLHFFLIGAAVFGLYDQMKPASRASERDAVLRLTEARAQRLAVDFAATLKRPPTPDEYLALVRDWTAEEVLVREALEMGLDKDDAVIRNRLRTKMEFLAEAPAAALTPDTAALEAFYRANRARYVNQGEISFEQVLLPRGLAAEDISRMKGRLEQGADPAAVGSATLLPAQIENMPVEAVDRIFGMRFAAAVTALPADQWAGPVSSGYGTHLIRLDAHQNNILPPLEALHDRVLADWRIAEARIMRDAYVKTLLERFTIELPDLTDEKRP